MAKGLAHSLRMTRRSATSSRQRKPVRRANHSPRRANGKRPAFAPVGKSETSVLRGLNSRTKRIPIHLLLDMVSSPGSISGSPGTTFEAIAHPGVRRCLRFISRNPCYKLSDLVKISALSMRGLNKAFRTHLGCAPGAVVVMVRLWNASELLANSRLPVAEVATRCGYRNSNSLYVALRRFLGTTPGRIRRQSPDYGVMDASQHHWRIPSEPRTRHSGKLTKA